MTAALATWNGISPDAFAVPKDLICEESFCLNDDVDKIALAFGLGFADSLPPTLAERPNPRKLRETKYEAMPEFIRGAARAGHVCAQPVLIHAQGVAGRELVDTSTGELFLDGGKRSFARPCGNRRERVCPHCSRRYRRDLYRVAMETLQADRPLTFVTLTADSMASEGFASCPHYALDGKGIRKAPTAEHVGAPVFTERFDYERAASFNAASGALYSDWLRRLKRILREREHARLLAAGASRSDARAGAKSASDVKVLRVAEFQSRGLVHHHLLLLGLYSDADLRAATDLAAASLDGYRHAYSSKEKGCHVKRVFRGQRLPDSADPGAMYAAYLGKYLTKSLSALVDSAAGPLARHYESLASKVLGLEDERAEKEACSQADAFDACELDALQWLAGSPDCPDEIELGLLTPCVAYRDDESFEYASLLRCRCLGCVAWRRKRRALEYLGLRGHIFTRSHSWGLSFTSLRKARRDHRSALAAEARGEALEVVYGNDGWTVEGVGLARVLALEDGLSLLIGSPA